MTTYNPPHYRDSNSWEEIPNTEFERLQKTLYPHLRKMGIKKTKPERIEIVKNKLKKQNKTCVFGKDVGGKYCWNESKENFIKTKDKSGEYNELKYIKLQWGHSKPCCRQEEGSVDDLYLQCARCNNQLQTSRRISQLEVELESKLLHIKRYRQ